MKSICVLLILIKLPLFSLIAQVGQNEYQIFFAFSTHHRAHDGLVYGLKPYEGEEAVDIVLNDIVFNKYRFHLRDKLKRQYDLYFDETHAKVDFISDLNSEIRNFSRAVIDLGFFNLNPKPFKEELYALLPEVDTFSIQEYFKAIAIQQYSEDNVYLAIIQVKSRDGGETAHYPILASKIRPSSRLFYVLIKDDPWQALKGFPDNDISIIKINEPVINPLGKEKSKTSPKAESEIQITEIKEQEPINNQQRVTEDLSTKPSIGYYIQLHGDTTETLKFTIHSITSSRTGKNYRANTIKAKGVIPLPLDDACIPRNLNDRLIVDIQKPDGYNLININHPDHPHNKLNEKHLSITVFGDEQINLMLTKLTAYHIVYIDLSGAINRQRVVSKLQELIHEFNQSKDDYLIFTSNFKLPLTLKRPEVLSNTESFNNYLRKLREIRPDPPSAAVSSPKNSTV